MSYSIKTLSSWAFPYTKYMMLRPLCSYGSKDLVSKTAAVSTPPDFLLQNIRIAQTPKSVLELVSTHYSVLNSKHIMQALRSMFELQKHGSSEMSTTEILRHPHFDKLCRKMKSQAGVFEVNESIEALKFMSYVGVPSDSRIVQVLLQLIRHNINELSLRHLIFLEFLLSQFKSCPLVDALKIALPLIFEIQLPLKMERDNVHELSEALHYVSKTKVAEKTVQLIVSALIEYPMAFEPKLTKSIIWSICDLPSCDWIEPLLSKATKDFVVNIDEMSLLDVETTLSKLAFKYSRQFPCYFNELFFDTCANYVIDKNLGCQTATYFMKRFIRLQYFNRYLLDYATNKLLEEHPDSLGVEKISNVYTLVLFMNLSEYRPKNWDKLKMLIVQCKQFGDYKKRDVIWLKFAACLCVLDVYKLDVLTKALNVGYLDEIFKRFYMNDLEHYLSIYWSIKLYKPDLMDLLPSKYEPENFISKFWPISEFPLEAALTKGLGGDNLVMTNLVSKLGYQIDHAILFRKGGYPVPVPEENPQYIEDINLTSDNKLVLIMCLKDYHLSINSHKKIRQTFALSMKVLEDKGYHVVPVCLDEWEGLNDFEKIPYLMQAIKNKLSSEQSSESAVYS